VIGYVLKMFPRFSETFILAEVLELERRGQRVEIIALKKPDDGCFHQEVARIRSRVRYLPEHATCHPMRFLAAHVRALHNGPRAYLGTLALALRCLPHSWPGWLRAPLVAELASQAGCRHLHAHFASLPALTAMLAARLLGLPFSFTAHAKDIFHHDCSPRILRLLMRRARRVVTVSDFNLRYLAGLLAARADRDKLVRVYNGVDLEQFSPALRPAASPPPLILAIGRLVEKKGFSDLIEALHLLRQRGLRFRCQIIGKGPLESALAAAIARFDLDAQVELTGPLPRAEIASRLRCACLLVAPSVVGRDGNREGLPTTLIEALACGVPTVATAVTGIPEAIEDHVSGLLVPPGEPGRLAQAIAELLLDPALRASMARAARERAESHFDLERNVGRLLEVFGSDPAAPVFHAGGDPAWPALAGNAVTGVGQ
jgi:glycosyltransferase involved in cell wall biosynthesis